MSLELDRKKYTHTDIELEQGRHEELIQMLNHPESLAYSEPITALRKLKETLAKFF